jgi:hypothetical protein
MIGAATYVKTLAAAPNVGYEYPTVVLRVAAAVARESLQ